MEFVGRKESLSMTEQSAVDELSAWYDAAKQRGVVEMTFLPGSDREVSREEAASVALAMLKYKAGVDAQA